MQQKIIGAKRSINRVVSLWLLIMMAAFALSCNSETKTDRLIVENERLKKENDSIKIGQAANFPPEVAPIVGDDSSTDEPVSSIRAGVHPISLHWISWDKPGKAQVKPAADGWYSISGSQKNENGDYLTIEGKIRRISEKELEFEGTIETRMSTINGAEPCVRQGPQRFFAKGSRTYFRLQQMENCEGGNLVDYIDIFPGTSSL